MASQALYDFSPVLQLMLAGGVIALGPLAWVWLRHRQTAPARRWRALTLLTLFLTFDLVLFGAFTRLTDSGLGCPDWPGCYGSASPMGARHQIAEAQQAMPTGPVTHGKAWIEMIHRYMATTVGVLILTLAVWAWRQSRPGGDPAVAQVRGWALLTLVWVCIQGAFGALTVTMKLFPAIVTLHLLGGLVLLSLLCVQAVRCRVDADEGLPAPRSAGRPDAASGAQTDLGSGSGMGFGSGQAPSWLRPALGACLALVWLQVALGGWVSTNYAVLACETFPACQGSWWPPMDFAQGFELWRPLGMTSAGQHIDFAALTAIHYVHRLAAYGVLASLAVLAWRLRTHAPQAGLARAMGLLAALQLLTGLSNVVLDWPLLAAVLHTGGAAALVVVLTWARLSLAGAPAEARSHATREVAA